jgi:VIT1/CCC1 family predicted Fe2+/Mn2+ transporter
MPLPSAANDGGRTNPASVELAEFVALRAEILEHQSAQATLVSVCLTAVGVLLGVVVSQGASRHLLLVVPFVASGLGLFYANHTMASQLIGQYIRDQLWPRLQAYSEGADVPSWEMHLSSLHRDKQSLWWRYFSLSFLGGTTVFVTPSVGALIVSAQDAFHHTFQHTWIVLVWTLDVLLLVLHISLAGLLAADASSMSPQPPTPVAAPPVPPGL